MTCANCQNKVERAIKQVKGVASVKVNWRSGTAKLLLKDNDLKQTEYAIKQAVKSAGYEVVSKSTAATGTSNRDSNKKGSQIALIVAIVLFLLLEILQATTNLLTNLYSSFPTAAADTVELGSLFAIGLLTSIHCISMCGGLNVSQVLTHANKYGDGQTVDTSTQPEKNKQADSEVQPQPKTPSKLQPLLLYNLGRVISYTIIGAIIGGIGSVFVIFGGARGIFQIIAGVFMLIVGLNLIGIVPGISRLTPSLPAGLANRLEKLGQRTRSAFIVGLLNGLMPCGPLQAMWVVALASGSALMGALAMGIFALGTVPLMFALGWFATMLTVRFRRRIMAIGGAFVLLFGLIMFSQGWVLSGWATPFDSLGDSSVTNEQTNSNLPAKYNGTSVSELDGDGKQIVKSTLQRNSYPAIKVVAGTPVKWTITVGKGMITGCNSKMIIPQWNKEIALAEGENIIEFTPEKSGKFNYSCWMGMIRSSITVV